MPESGEGVVKGEGKGREKVELLFSVREAADYLCISVQSIYRMINNRGISFVKIGHRCLIKQSTLEKMVKEGTVKARGGNGKG